MDAATAPIRTPPSRAPRADAARNRTAIVAAAAAAFAESGHAVDVREIAGRAGVGVGTLYRHFRTKDELLQTVLREEYLTWAGAAARAAEADADAWAALVGFLEDALRRQARHAAICEHLATAGTADSRCASDLVPIIDGLVARCHAQGRLAPDVTADDITLLLVTLGHAVRIAGPGDRRPWHRLLDLALLGIAARP
jgi:AcrR family transcriptional regulator